MLYLFYYFIIMTKKGRTITMDEEIWNKAVNEAKKENRPISNFIETVLLRYFEEEKAKKKAE